MLVIIIHKGCAWDKEGTYHLNKRRTSSRPPLWHRLLIRRRIERNKQQQITAQNTDTRHSRKLLTSALSRARHPRPVRRREIRVRRKVHESEIEHELRDLHNGDVLFPPDADAPCGLEVVPVHDDVDGEIEDDGDPGDGGVAEELGVAEESGCAVVVRVEEGWRGC